LTTLSMFVPCDGRAEERLRAIVPAMEKRIYPSEDLGSYRSGSMEELYNLKIRSFVIFFHLMQTNYIGLATLNLEVSLTFQSHPSNCDELSTIKYSIKLCWSEEYSLRFLVFLTKPCRLSETLTGLPNCQSRLSIHSARFLMSFQLCSLPSGYTPTKEMKVEIIMVAGILYASTRLMRRPMHNRGHATLSVNKLFLTPHSQPMPKRI